MSREKENVYIYLYNYDLYGVPEKAILFVHEMREKGGEKNKEYRGRETGLRGELWSSRKRERGMLNFR